MTLASELRAFVSVLRECGRPGLAEDLSALSNRVASLERAWDEIVSDAAEAADNAERAARMNVVPLRPRLRLVGSPAWHGPSDGVG